MWLIPLTLKVFWVLMHNVKHYLWVIFIRKCLSRWRAVEVGGLFLREGLRVRTLGLGWAASLIACFHVFKSLFPNPLVSKLIPLFVCWFIFFSSSWNAWLLRERKLTSFKYLNSSYQSLSKPNKLFHSKCKVVKASIA